MTNTILFTRGSIHQGHERFSEISRGRQCSYMSFTALLCARVHPVQQWSRVIVDQILFEGDRMYLNALQNDKIPDAETISLDHLPKRLRLNWSATSVQTSTLNLNFISDTESPDVVRNADLPDAVEPDEAKSKTNTSASESPDVVRNTDLPDEVEPDEAPKNCNRWLINYGEFYQGRISYKEHENGAPFLTIRSALMNTFMNDNYAFLIIAGYIIALIKSRDSIFVFDSHARNCFGMPDENGTAVVMKCANIDSLVEFIHSLSLELQRDLFEVVPVAINNEQTENQSQLEKNLLKAREYKKRKRSNETECERQARLDELASYRTKRKKDETELERQARLDKKKAYQQKKLLAENESERQARLDKKKAYQQKKLLAENESERQTRLDKKKAYQQKKLLADNESERQARLDKKKAYQHKKHFEENEFERLARLDKKRIYNRNKGLHKDITVQSLEKNSKQSFLKEFDNAMNGELHEQTWANANMFKFHNSNTYTVSHCTVCREAWPLKCRPKNPDTYICSKCSRDKKSPKKFSAGNLMIPSSVPLELQGLSQIEEMLISRALPIMRVYIKPGGQRGYSGHCINLPQNVNELASSLPRYPKDLSVIIVKVKGKDNTFRDVNVRRQKIHDALVWLVRNNPQYSDVQLNESALNALPVNGVPMDLSTIETEDDMSDNTVEPDIGPPTDNPTEDSVYNESTDMSSFLPVGEQQQQELDAIRNQLSADEPMTWPTVEDQPLNEYQTPYLATMAFPTLFPDGKGDPTNQALVRDVPLAERVKHLIKFAEKIDGKWIYRFASHPRFSYWAFNMILRKRTLQQSGIFLKQNPGEAHLTVDELREMATSNNSGAFMSKVSRYVANIAGTNAYWYRVKEDLKAIVTNVGTPTFFFTFSSADMHWPELHALFQNDDNMLTSQQRRQNVINNPHIVDWYFSQRLEHFVKYWLYDTLDAKWHWYRFEYQGRGSIHCHGTAKLNNDPGLCELTNAALKGYLAQELKKEKPLINDPQLEQDIEAGTKAAETACQYVDWLLSTVNPNPPDQDMWIRPDVHPCQKLYKDIPAWDSDSDYVDLLNMVQRHTRCSTSYCLRKKGNSSELKCRFHFPFDDCPQTKLEFEKVHSKNNTEVQYRAKIVTKRNDSRLNNNQRLQLQGWRANCDIQVVIDHYACVEYLTKYAAKGETRSPVLKQAFNSIVQSTNTTSDPHKAIKKVVMKSLGERDYAAQETMHHLLSLKLHSSSFNVIPVSLNGSRRVHIDPQGDGDLCTDCSLLDVYANREHYDNSPYVVNMNFIQFASKFKVTNGKLTQLPPNSIPRVFPVYSSNPRGPNFSLYCKYQLLRYKPWKLSQNNAWSDQEPSDEVFITSWHDFLQTPYAEANVPDWFDKLQDSIQTQEEPDRETVVSDNSTREEWMIISDLRTPFENSNQSLHDWHQDRVGYTEQQIGEMPAWIKAQQEEAADISNENYQAIDLDSFSEMQKHAYDIVKSHYEDSSVDTGPLCLIVIGVAGTGKSYLINGLRNLLQNRCAVTATTGKASYNIRGITIHSLLKLPVGPRGNNDLKGQALLRLQQSLQQIDYILIDEYSMLGQTTFGWIDRRCKQATGSFGKILGGKSLILIGDPGQLPPVADKPLYHAKPSNAMGEQGYQAYKMFDRVVKLTVNQRVQGRTTEQQQFRDLLLRLRKGESTPDDWKLLLTRQRSNVSNIDEFGDAVRLYYSNLEVATYNHEQLSSLKEPTAHINARHSSSTAKNMPSDEMSGLEPTIFLAKGAKVMLTMNLWATVGLCNGATGTVIDIIYQNGNQPPDLPIAVIVQFDDYRGPSISDTLQSCVPICPITVSAQLLEGIHERQQVPLRLAYALTIHKSQGLTLPKAWIDIGRSERTPGVSYVAISRVKTLSSCIIEPVTFERLTSLKSSKTLQYRLDEEARLDNIAQATSSASSDI